MVIEQTLMKSSRQKAKFLWGELRNTMFYINRYMPCMPQTLSALKLISFAMLL